MLLEKLWFWWAGGLVYLETTLIPIHLKSFLPVLLKDLRNVFNVFSYWNYVQKP